MGIFNSRKAFIISFQSKQVVKLSSGPAPILATVFDNSRNHSWESFTLLYIETKENLNILLIYFIMYVPVGQLFRCWILYWIVDTELNTLLYWIPAIPTGSYLSKVNSGNTRIICKICSKLTMWIPDWHQWHRDGAFSVNFDKILNTALVFPWLSLNK